MNKVELLKLVDAMNIASLNLANAAILSKKDEFKVAAEKYEAASMAVIDAIKELP